MSSRIETIVSLLRPNHPLFDLCCDHGLIGLMAWHQDPTRSVRFVDQSAAALEPLQQKLQQDPYASADLAISLLPAEDLTAPMSSSDFVIAGVGNGTIITILEHLFPLHLGSHRLVLATQQPSLELRRYLRLRQWGLICERLVFERGRYREILCLEALGLPVELRGEFFAEPDQQMARTYREQIRLY